MNPLTLLANAYLRWRHSHGFGVHSPFAYNLVTMAVRPGKYGYYGYELIDRVILTPGKRYDRDVRRDARLLLRLLVALGSRRLLIAAADPEPFRAAAEVPESDAWRWTGYPPAPTHPSVPHKRGIAP